MAYKPLSRLHFTLKFIKISQLSSIASAEMKFGFPTSRNLHCAFFVVPFVRSLVVRSFDWINETWYFFGYTRCYRKGYFIFQLPLPFTIEVLTTGEQIWVDCDLCGVSGFHFSSKIKQFRGFRLFFRDWVNGNLLALTF